MNPPPGRNTSGLCDVIEETEFSYEVFHMFVRFLYGDKHIIHRSQDFQQLFELLHMAKEMHHNCSTFLCFVVVQWAQLLYAIEKS